MSYDYSTIRDCDGILEGTRAGDARHLMTKAEAVNVRFNTEDDAHYIRVTKTAALEVLAPFADDEKFPCTLYRDAVLVLGV